MICVQTVKKFCKDDISQIENYANAIRERQSASLKKYCDTNQGKSALSKATRGTQWYNNGKINVRSFDCPLGFVKGRLKFR